MGRVGADPELRGNDRYPVVTFTMATNDQYTSTTGQFLVLLISSDITNWILYSIVLNACVNISGEITSVAEWHRVAVFRTGLRDVILERIKKG